MEISVFEDFTSVLIQPEAYRQITSIPLDVDVPIFVPSSLDVFADMDAYVAAAYGAVGNDPTQIPAVDSACAVTSVNVNGVRPSNRYMVAAQVVEYLPIEGVSEFVFGAVTLDEFGDALLVLPSMVAVQAEELPIVWCACDRISATSDYGSLSFHYPNDPHLLFHVGLKLASQYAPITLWQLMVEVGACWSVMVAMLTRLELEGYRVRRTTGAIELYFVEQLVSSHVSVSPTADADASCEALLTAIDSLLRDTVLRADPAVGEAAKHLARQVLSKVPTRVLAKYVGKDSCEMVEQFSDSAAGGVEHPQALGCPASLKGLDINVYDRSTWGWLQDSQSLVKATLCNNSEGDFSSVFTVGSMMGDCVELECVVTSRLFLVHPRDLRDISVVGHSA